MNKRIINLAIGVVLAFVAIYLINARLQERENIIRDLIREGELTEVVAAIRDIPKNEVIDRNMIALARVPTKDILPGSIKSPESILGKVANVDILKGQYIYSTMLRLPEQAETLSQKTPKGKRAYAISIDSISAVGGKVRPGDNVDVIGIMSIPAMSAGGKEVSQSVVLTLFETVKILDMDPGKSITLALDSEEIKILTYALQMGKIRLVLRSPLDVAQEGTFKPFTFDSFMQKVYAAMGIDISQPLPKVEEEMPSEVEIYRGGQ